MLIDAGFALDLDTGPDCDLLPSNAACILGGQRGSDHIQVGIYNPGDEDGDVVVADPDRALVRIVAAQN